MVDLRVLPGVPAELENGHDDGHRKAADLQQEAVTSIAQDCSAGVSVTKVAFTKNITSCRRFSFRE